MIFYLTDWEHLVHPGAHCCRETTPEPEVFSPVWIVSSNWGEWVTGDCSSWQGRSPVAIVSACGKWQCLELAISQNVARTGFCLEPARRKSSDRVLSWSWLSQGCPADIPSCPAEAFSLTIQFLSSFSTKAGVILVTAWTLQCAQRNWMPDPSHSVPELCKVQVCTCRLLAAQYRPSLSSKWLFH